MTTQTRRTRKAPVKKEEASLQKDTIYEIVNGGGIVHMIKQNGVTFFDENKGEIRSIRYCPNEKSIYTDEQSDLAVREPIVFRDKILGVPRTKPNLREYLEAHPENVKNGGTTFKEIDKAKTAEESLTMEFQSYDAVALVREKDINELIPVAIYFGVDVNTSSSEIRFNLLRLAKSNPSSFISSFDSPMVKTKSIVYKAKEFNIISYQKDGVYWVDSGSMICAVPVGMDPSDVISRFLLSEKGATVMSTLEDMLSKL